MKSKKKRKKDIWWKRMNLFFEIKIEDEIWDQSNNYLKLYENWNEIKRYELLLEILIELIILASHLFQIKS